MGTLQYRLVASAALAAAVALSSVSSTNADEHRVIVGMATTSVNVTTWWHGENALDLTNRVGPTDTDVYHQSHFQSGNGGWLRAVARNYSISTTCHGRYVDLYDPGNNYLGTLNYVHVLSSLPENYTWIIPASGWNIVYLGAVIDPEPSDCDWHGAHLHQGGVGANVQYNAGLESYVASQGQPDIITPTGDYTNRWIDRVTLIDSDGDGCSDQEELGPNQNLGGLRDPHNPWDFFDVPLPVGAPGTGHRDKQIDGNDFLAVLSKFGSVLGDPIPTAPRYDPAYDRSAPSPNVWNTHAPNGVVDGNDAIWALDQFGHSCVLPP